MNGPENPEKGIKVDVTQFAGSSGREETRHWSIFAQKHLKEMRVLKEALILGKENKDWRNVSEHVLVVGALAGFLARKLKDKGQNIDSELVESAAILHDASKRLDVEKKVRYDTEKKSIRLENLLRKFGYSEEFLRICSYTGRVPEIFLEEEEQNKAIKDKSIQELVIAYSDARVRNVNIVSLEEARDKNKEKVPEDSDFYDKWFVFYTKVERIISEKMEDFQTAYIDNGKILQSISEK